MKLNFKISFLFATLLLWGCQQEDHIDFKENSLIVGNWVNPATVSDTLWQFNRGTSLNPGDYGFCFQADQKFIERKNAGWCGTPPISYADFDGNWSQTDSILNISVAYWGGEAEYRWKIISLDEDKLVVYKVKEDYRLE